MILDVSWETVDDDRTLLELLPSATVGDRFVFVEGDEGAVGWGVAARIDVGSGPDRFARARSRLGALPGGPLAFASFTFDEDEDPSVVVVPRVAVLRRGGSTRRMTVGDSVPKAATSTEPAAAGWPRFAGSTVRDERWLEAVAEALEAIASGTLDKVVLARDLHVWSRNLFDVDRLLHDLAERFPSCMTFLVDGLIGASPERLLRREGAAIASRVLAGTARRGKDEQEDAVLGAALFASTKDRHEHDLALQSAVDVLSPHCNTLRVPDEPSLVRLDNVQHLGSEIAGTLRPSDGGSVHILDLLAELHPTAAVGGSPRAPALRAIRALEGMSRGRYAGPVGWWTPDGDGEFAIALRCAVLQGDRARLFAGAGIVAGSLPEAELTETWLKLQAMTGVLGA